MKVIIIGAGAIGCSTAYHLRKLGMEVEMVDAAEAASEASRVAAGILTIVTDKPVFNELTVLSLKSLEYFKEFIPEIEKISGLPAGYHPSDLMRVASGNKDKDELSKAREFCRIAGVDVQWISGSEVNRLEPELRFTGSGALFAPNQAQIDTTFYCPTLVGAARNLGVKIREKSPVYGFIKEGGRVAGVRLAREELKADAVLIASGAWTGRVGALMEAAFPVEPVKGQIETARVRGKLLKTIVYSGTDYLCQRPSGLFLAGTTFERRGFDRGINQDARERILHWAQELLPELSQVRFDSTLVNFRPGTAEGMPLMGKVPGWDGLWISSGHYRKGIILSPLAGKLMAQAILKGETPQELAPFIPVSK